MMRLQNYNSFFTELVHPNERIPMLSRFLSSRQTRRSRRD